MRTWTGRLMASDAALPGMAEDSEEAEWDFTISDIRVDQHRRGRKVGAGETGFYR